MNEQTVIDILSQTLVIALKLSAPMLLASLVLGLIIRIFPTLTSIQEQTLTFVPKLFAVFLVLIIAGSWILTGLREYVVELFNFSSYLG